ncbi:hypothetical protein WAI453_011177 [Rhynchosporium graminicola]
MFFVNALLVGFAAHVVANSDAKLGAVASESAVCSRIGTDILKSGGNAADAYDSTQFCVGVIAMYHSGLGGGGFATVRSKHGTYEFIDFREMAPAASFQTMFSPPLSNAEYSLYGGLASGVPGEVRGLEYIHKKYGSLPWKQVILPAVKVARYGFPVTADLVRYMDTETFMVTDKAWAIDFAPNGTRLGVGDTMTRKRYADTLETIANEGPDAYYHGHIAETTIKALQASNGTMTLSDLANYTTKLRPTVNIKYRGFKIHTGSAPSSGAVVASILKIIEGYDMSTPSKLNESVHYLDEAMRFAFGQRTLLGDPEFLSNLTTYQEGMHSDATAAEIRTLIKPDRTLNVSDYNPSAYQILTDHGTSAVVASDKSGLTISMTSTINTKFGSRLMIPETGIIMNNEMNDFGIPNTINYFGLSPSKANFVEPFKRPLSFIAPVIVERADGCVYISHSAAGGSRIITEVAQHLWHILDQNMTSAQALAQPRMHDQLAPNTVSFEWASDFQGVKGYDNKTTAYLSSLGSSVSFIAPGSTSGQGLRILSNGTFEAAGDPRQLNSAGYAV